MIELEKLFEGNKRVISKAISIIENEEDSSKDLCKRIFPRTGKAYRIGITGPPGAGKSTITLRITQNLIKSGFKVGILAVDPTSPFTGGALLGDRVRMQELALEKNVFVRSMATRGSLGGLSKKTRDAADVLDASGKDIIIMETVGVGQSELDIAKASDTTIVVLVPESGDSIQAMKAGLMEIADIFVVNKSDRDGADEAVLAIKNMLELRVEKVGWDIPVHKTIASTNQGIDEVVNSIFLHKDYLINSNLLKKKRKNNLINMIHEIVSQELKINFWNEEKENYLSNKIENIYNREFCVYDFVKDLFKYK
ncbi:MAG TPA: methylmalonyl Co-A mutase-associated GTPase MeaB [Ignavibacteria bacterium]